MRKNNFYFFTNPYFEWPYHLIPFKVWDKGYNKAFNELIIDCGVNTLKNMKEYLYINKYPLSNLAKNVFWVIPDYPFDLKVNLSQNECIKKSLENIYKWGNYKNTISSIQYKFENFENFKIIYNEVYPISNNIGIGNLCKSRNMIFLKNVINYIFLHNKDKRRIHFFGLYKKAIKYIINLQLDFKISVDSMKWDYGLHKNRTKGSLNNTKIERWKYFLEYYNSLFL